MPTPGTDRVSSPESARVHPEPRNDDSAQGDRDYYKSPALYQTLARLTESAPSRHDAIEPDVTLETLGAAAGLAVDWSTLFDP